MPIQVVSYNPDNCINLIAAVAISEGDLVGVDSAGLAAKADCNATLAAAVAVEAIGVAKSTVAVGEMLAICPMCVVDGLASLVIGTTYWLSATAGAYTATRPTTAGDIAQRVGIATKTTQMVYNVCPPALAHQTTGNSVANLIA